MALRFYIEKDNGDLRFIEEVDGTENVEEALKALVEALPRHANSDFKVISDDSMVDAGFEEVVTTTRQVRIGGRNGNGAEVKPKPATRKPPARQGTKKPASKPAQAKAPAKGRGTSKPAAKKPAAKAAPKKGGSPFKRNAAQSDD